MRYELTDYEWHTIKPFLPNKPRGVPRVNDRRVLNGIFWVLRSGAPWRDLPSNFGPYTTCYNRFVRWRRAGVWTRIMNALAATHDAAVQMIDTSIIRVHQHAACIARNKRQSMGRSRGGLTSKIHAVVDTNGLPIRLALTMGEAHDNRLAGKLLSRMKSGTMLLADRGYDADWIRALAAERGVWANIPPRCNRNEPICFSPYLYRARNLVERFFNKIKQCRRVATRYDNLAANRSGSRVPRRCYVECGIADYDDFRGRHADGSREGEDRSRRRFGTEAENRIPRRMPGGGRGPACAHEHAQ